MSVWQCKAHRQVWVTKDGGANIICVGQVGHPDRHYANWGDSYLTWDNQPQCPAWSTEPTTHSHRACLDAEGHDGPHWSYKDKGLKVVWEGDGRFPQDLQARYDFHDDLGSPTAQKLYAPTDVQQAVWAHEGKAWEQIIARAMEPRRADQTALGAPRTYAERKARRKKVS